MNILLDRWPLNYDYNIHAASCSPFVKLKPIKYQCKTAFCYPNAFCYPFTKFVATATHFVYLAGVKHICINYRKTWDGNIDQNTTSTAFVTLMPDFPSTLEHIEMVVYQLSPIKRICVFEHSVMANFNCACLVIQRGQGSGFLSEGSS